MAMSRCLAVVLCVLLLTFLGAGVAAADPYYVTVLGPLGTFTYSSANGMAIVGNAPETVGWSGGSSGWDPVSWNSSGVATNLLSLIPGAAAARGDQATGIDSDGDIVGQAVVGGVNAAFYIPGSGRTGVVLPTLNPNSPSAYAAGVSDSGFVVGYSTASDGNPHAFVWSASGGMVDLGTSGAASYATGISANGNTVIGDIDDTPGQLGQAVEWTRSGSTWTMTASVSGSVLSQSAPYAINSSGVMVGAAFLPASGGPPSPVAVGFAYQSNGTVVQFGSNGLIGNGSGIAAYGINDSGVIVGGSWPGQGAAFVNYTGASGGAINLQTLLSPVSGAGWTLDSACGIDDNGDIAGNMENSTGQYPGYLLTPALPGDANLDGKVDINDLTIVLANYGQTGMVWSQGEFTGDGKVDINDLTIVLSNYGHSIGSSAGPMAPVPEPASVVLLACCGLAALLAGAWRRRG
jgi:probable HAF family extracellular repeat protein